VCLNGLVRCEGSWVERCMAGVADAPVRWVQMEDCHVAALCVAPGMCVPPLCEPQELRCHGSVPQRCRADRMGWVDDVLAGACCGAERCLDAGPCQQGQCACSGDTGACDGAAG
jgi:hypothetical protein